jgi:hypothetical protein
MVKRFYLVKQLVIFLWTAVINRFAAASVSTSGDFSQTFFLLLGEYVARWSKPKRGQLTYDGRKTTSRFTGNQMLVIKKRVCFYNGPSLYRVNPLC